MGLAVLNLWFCHLLLFKIIYLPVLGLSCSEWDLVPWPGIEPVSPALGVWCLSCWTTREVPVTFLLESAFSRAWASGPIEPGGTWCSGWRPRRQAGSLLRWSCHQESQRRLLSQAGLCHLFISCPWDIASSLFLPWLCFGCRILFSVPIKLSSAQGLSQASQAFTPRSLSLNSLHWRLLPDFVSALQVKHPTVNSDGRCSTALLIFGILIL